MAKLRCDRELEAELDACMAWLLREPGSLRTVARIGPVVDHFARFTQIGSKVGRLAEVTSEVAVGFVRSRLSSGLAASVATMHDRRSTLRLLFRVARRLELANGDPTLDLALPPRSARGSRPLTDTEIEVARDVALWSLASRRIAAAWALAEATGRGAELSAVGVDDLDLDGGRVWLHSGKRTIERWGELTEWGVRVLSARVKEIGTDDRLVYAGERPDQAGQVATCSAISTVLVRAGLAGEPDVRPGSVAGWAGRRAFDNGANIGDVGRLLGVRSLDQAAGLIGWDWAV